MAEFCKFDELRIKTEEQLVQLIQNELERGIRSAQQALQSDVAGEWYLRANRAYAEASRLIPLAVEMADDQRNRVESRLDHLRGMLEALAAFGSTPSPAEDEIAALARAFWHARGCPEGLPEEDWFRAERALRTPSGLNAACLAG
jgi:hypothetical protein